jgi:hypothetical protein
MAAPKLVSALVAFSRCLNEARSLANDAQKWSIPRKAGGRAQITMQRRDTFMEVAFLRAYTGWEIFLEESFLLYLIGHKAPKAPRPVRCGFPADRAAASEWCTDGRDYAKWNVNDVRRRADRWLEKGKPFTPVLQGQQSRLEQLITIRNAIAHESSAARTKFENLVRSELGALPPNTTVGNFLITLAPGFTPPTSFMELYLDKIELAAKTIVPR